MHEAPEVESPAPETSSAASPEKVTETTESPTYQHDQWYGLDHYTCLLCGQEDWSEPTLRQHMQAYHRGAMVEAPPGYEPPPHADEEPLSDEASPEPPGPDEEPTEGVHDG